MIIKFIQYNSGQALRINAMQWHWPGRSLASLYTGCSTVVSRLDLGLAEEISLHFWDIVQVVDCTKATAV